MAASRRTTQPTAEIQLQDRLVLQQWMLGLFEAKDLDGLVKSANGDMTAPQYEGMDGENRTHFCRYLTTYLFDFPELPRADLLRYDENIVRHWTAITEKRLHQGQRLMPKYFQYLALLFTEIYLDRYFGDPDALLAALNRQVAELNARINAKYRLQPFGPNDLNKLAFWMATGSGKTLLLHVHLLQFRHYLEQAGRQRDLNRIVLLTPNEGLSRQHLEELTLSGIDAEIFSREGGRLYAGQVVEIIDIHKLREQAGDKTVAVSSFESRNLVFVDEGHRGASSTKKDLDEIGAWMDRRSQLCEDGFSFEYSATFGQAVGATGKLADVYARSILFDYRYKYFYADGYGKDYHILNLDDDTKSGVRDRYLTACLLAFYQQRRLFRDKPAELRPFLIEEPLLVLVGGKVTKSLSQQEGSDITSMLQFLAGFVGDEPAAVERIRKLLSGRTDLLDQSDRDIFANAFGYLRGLPLAPEQIYADLLRAVFNAQYPAALHVEQLKGADGELALRVGAAQQEFGVINVGDAGALAALCRQFEPPLVVEEREFAGSLFGEINRPGSPITMLIGAKKFMEGWNSWRVSTMGLMNVGKTEGSNIIQLFGRGVRLKGWEFSLKRSGRLPDLNPPEHVEVLETLNIFGVHASYMQQFKLYLSQEGLPANEERVSIVLPVVRTTWSQPLQTLRLPEPLDFKLQGPTPVVSEAPPEGLDHHSVILDWYPRIESRRSSKQQAPSDVVTRDEGRLADRHLAFLDWGAIYSEIQQFKAERSWHNLSLPRDAVRALFDCDNAGWYQLYIPRENLDLGPTRNDPRGLGERIREWQEIAVILLREYVRHYYTYRKSEWELPRLRYFELRADDSNLLKEEEGYRFLVEQSQESIITTLRALAEEIGQRRLAPAGLPVDLGPNGQVFTFARHLYQPLVYLGASEFVEVKPVPLNAGERNLVTDLRAYYDANTSQFADRDLYLLRNQSRGRGIGFFEAGGFYPDFILWLVHAGRQCIAFVDPKGLRNIGSVDHPKLRFRWTIKDLQERLDRDQPAGADRPEVTLHSFILSTTPYSGIPWRGTLAVADFESRHVLFRPADGDGAWVAKMLVLMSDDG